MQKVTRVASVLPLLLGAERAQAVPRFARQMGLSCNVCHSNPPELTAFGRNFKLMGMVGDSLLFLFPSLFPCLCLSHVFVQQLVFSLILVRQQL